MKLIKKYRKEHERIAYYIRVYHFEEALKLVPKGYTIYPQDDGSYLCQLPEGILFDLSDLNLPFAFSKEYPIKVYNHIKKNIDLILKAGSIIYGSLFEITGNCLQGQIRIAGKEINLLKMFIEDFLNSLPKRIKDESQDDRIIATPVMKEENNRKTWSREVVMFHNRIREVYQDFCLFQYKNFMPIFNCNTAFSHPIWDEINKLGAHYVFFLQSGLPLALGFIQTTRNLNNVSLIERHISQDYYSFFRKKPLFYQKFDNYEVSSTTVLIDNVFSGNTLKEVKLEEPSCKTLALFPKSCINLKFFDWIVYNSCL
ncbi:MAG: hypothetical protein ACFFDN_16415, partial [Candidatus Hodarchaeota archaeon]